MSTEPPDERVAERLPPTDAAPAADDRRTAVRQAISVSAAVGVYGISFGALGVAAGLDLWQTMALSLLMFTGGSQFAFIGVLGAGGAAGAAIVTAALLGARNALYGAALAPLLRTRGPRRWAAAQLTIDESMAVAVAQRSAEVARTGFWWTGLGVYVLWNLFTVVGAGVGDALGDPTRWGLDAAAAAAFLGLLWPRLAGHVAQAVAAGAVVVALLLTPVAPPGVPILAAALVAVVVGWRDPRPRLGRVARGGRMSPYAATWVAVLAASAVCFATKLTGHRVPEHWLAHPRVARIAGLVTVALLAGLVAVQAFTTDGAVVLDARVAALAVAAVALALRAPFVVVVVLAAVVAAVLRALG